MNVLKGTTFRVVSATSALAIAGALTLAGTASAAQLRDSDHDGMPNRWEVAHGLNAHKANARGDKDADGQRTLAEYRDHTAPADDDTDGDGIDDGDEVHDGCTATDPTDDDTDGDGVEDGNEDNDGDGIDNADDDQNQNCDDDDQGEDDNSQDSFVALR